LCALLLLKQVSHRCSEAKISNFENEVLTEQDVLSLDVSVGDLVQVHVFKALDELPKVIAS
jgi:hypothetical protein